MHARAENGDVFEIQSEPIDVTRMSRPDTSWRFTDATGHEHQWYVNGQPAKDYQPANTYELPTLRWIVEIEATDEYPEIGHHECRQCAEHVRPRNTCDTHKQFIAGPARFYVNGHPVSQSEYVRRAKAAYPHIDFSGIEV